MAKVSMAEVSMTEVSMAGESTTESSQSEKKGTDIRKIDRELTRIEQEICQAKKNGARIERFAELYAMYDKTAGQAVRLTPHDRLYLARHQRRPKVTDYIQALFDDFFVQRGDRLEGDDPAVFGGIGLFHGTPVTVIGHRKGKNLEENLRVHFGMPEPEGYRKALRMMKQAEKFGRPVITLIDTPGASPDIHAEEHGQSQAIAQNLAEMSHLKVPVISIVTGEGSSGGALAIGVANEIYMLENAVYSVLSPEGFASILWKDSGKAPEACRLMRFTAQDLLQLGVTDGIIREPFCGAHHNPTVVYNEIEDVLTDFLKRYRRISGTEAARMRQEKFRNIDRQIEQKTERGVNGHEKESE